MPMPSSLIVFKMEPLRGHALLAMDSFLVYLLLDHYFGGSAQTHVKPEGRDFTPIQRRIIRNIATLALVELQKAWQAAQPIRPEIVRLESNPQFAMVIASTELSIVIKLSINLGETERDFFLCYPYSMLEPLKEKLYAGFMSDQFEVDQHWSARFRDEIHHCLLKVEAELGQASIQVGELMNFAPGDVILLNKSLGDPNVVSIEGIPKFLGMPGTLKGQQALQIVSLIKPGD
jgi:flagellar motor switch protein FliM